MAKATVEILVGMIASGKSTYAAKRAKEGAIIINNDAITLAVHGGDYRLWHHSNQPLYKGVAVAIFTHAATLGRDIVLDQTSMSRHTRATWIALARQFNMKSRVVEFQQFSPEEHGTRRAAGDARHSDSYTVEEWIKIAEKHAGQYDEPDNLVEGFSDYIYVPWRE